MKEVGFVSYKEEWWHYDFGNQFAAQIGRTHGREMVAKYGLIEDLTKVKVIDAEELTKQGTGRSLSKITQTALELKEKGSSSVKASEKGQKIKTSLERL